MIIRVDAVESAARIESPRDFRAFSVRIDGRFESAAQRAAVIGRIGEREDGSHVWVREQSLRDWPGLASEAWWREGLDGMVVAARKFGFYDERGGLIRAHVETGVAARR